MLLSQQPSAGMSVPPVWPITKAFANYFFSTSFPSNFGTLSYEAEQHGRMLALQRIGVNRGLQVHILRRHRRRTCPKQTSYSACDGRIMRISNAIKESLLSHPVFYQYPAANVLTKIDCSTDVFHQSAIAFALAGTQLPCSDAR